MSSDRNINKLFRFNDENTYTHFDIYRARELNLHIELNIFVDINCLLFSRDKLLTGSELFGSYVDILFKLKKQKVTPRAKQILNILWGALGERKTKKSIISDDKDNSFNIEEDSKLILIKPYDDKNTLIEISNNDRQYQTNWGRLCPFLISKARCKMSKIIEPYKENVMRFHTDGFIITNKLNDAKDDGSLGSLKFEGHYLVKVLNCNKIIYQNNN
jgi:hypothetical protein